jgi:hypothetical protein
MIWTEYYIKKAKQAFMFNSVCIIITKYNLRVHINSYDWFKN